MWKEEPVSFVNIQEKYLELMSDTRYGLPSFPFKVFQAPTFTAFIQSITKPKEKTPAN
ncbi:hypothetical protein ABET08_12275 [Bacillus subtilis]